MAQWQDMPGVGLQIEFHDATEVVIKTEDAEEIAESMTAEAMKLAKAQRSQAAAAPPAAKEEAASAGDDVDGKGAEKAGEKAAEKEKAKTKKHQPRP